MGKRWHRIPMRAGRKLDANQREVIDGLRAEGFLVQEIGDPIDILVYAGRLVLFEIKDGKKVPSARKLTPAEQEFVAQWSAAGAEVYVVLNLAEAIAKLRAPAKSEVEVDSRQADLIEVLKRNTNRGSANG